jgi:hypothetical protein
LVVLAAVWMLWMTCHFLNLEPFLHWCSCMEVTKTISNPKWSSHTLINGTTLTCLWLVTGHWSEKIENCWVDPSKTGMLRACYSAVKLLPVSINISSLYCLTLCNFMYACDCEVYLFKFRACSCFCIVYKF